MLNVSQPIIVIGLDSIPIIIFLALSGYKDRPGFNALNVDEQFFEHFFGFLPSKCFLYLFITRFHLYTTSFFILAYYS